VESERIQKGMKVLVIRFSSIGDIVLTSPIVRALKTAQHTVHFVTKTNFAGIVQYNPNIERVFTFKKNISEVIPALKAEGYDTILDLHHNIRSLRLKWALGVPSYSFPKLNWKKWQLVWLKRNRLPDIHVVDRYFQTLAPLSLLNDGLGIDFFIPQQEEVDTEKMLGLPPASYISVAIGGQFATKQMPVEKMAELLAKINYPIVLLGGKEDAERANRLISLLREKLLVSACGDFSLQQSASIVKQSSVFITHDTGLMHIASAFEVPIVSIWGNTVPALGMYPYRPNVLHSFSIHEVQILSCRPCSKIGFKQCPKGHFRCMLDQDAEAIAFDVESRAKKIPVNRDF
jgi:ADP-heptose:LPS heptosyltransferase